MFWSDSGLSRTRRVESLWGPAQLAFEHLSMEISMDTLAQGVDIAGPFDCPTGPEGVRAFQSLAERFERIDDEVRRLEARIDPAGDRRLARTKVRRMALLQEIAVIIGVGHS